MTWNIFVLMGIIKEKLYVERQGWRKQRCSTCSSGAACENNNSEQDAAAQPRTGAAEVDAGCVFRV